MGLCQTVFRMGFSCLVHPLWESPHSHTYGQTDVPPSVILNLVEVTVKVNLRTKAAWPDLT